MRILNDILKFKDSSKELRLLTYSLTLILLWSLFENYLQKIFVSNLIPIFEKLNFTLFSEILIFAFFVAFLFLRLIQILAKFCEDKFISYTTLPLSGIYIYYRFFDSSFRYYNFSFCKKVAYLDILILFFLSSLILLIINYYLTYLSEKERKLMEDEKLNDYPWEVGRKDLFNRYAGAKNLALKIISQKAQNSFAYGINGGWGDGKTSFLNMIENELQKNSQTIVVKFNPWKSTSSKNIHNDFLVKLKESLSPFSSEVPPKINQYIHALFGANKNIFLNAISIITQEQSEITKQFEILNNAISKIGKKIVIIIDDIDRLDKEEVFEVLKLIRNIGNFHNTIFIAAYDRNYINGAIKKFSDSKHEAFVEKIFQQEIVLPDYPFSILLNELVSKLKEHFLNEKRIIPEIESILRINDDMILFSTGIVPYKNSLMRMFRNLRDVKRFLNAFIDCYTPIKDEVNFFDMFYLEVLKTKYYKIFIGLKLKTFLKTHDNNANFYKLDKQAFDSFCKKEKVKDNEIPYEILNHLFPDGLNSKNRNVIGFKKSFPVYFSNQLFNRLTRKKFYEVVSGEKESLNEELDKWISQNYYIDVREYLESTSYDLFENKNEFENFIELHILLMDKGFSINEDLLLFNFYGDLKHQISRRFYESDEVYNNYIINLIEKSNSPTSIGKLINKLILNYLSSETFSFILSLKELQQQALKYLRQYLLGIPDLDENAMRLYYACIEEIDVDRKVHLMEEASMIMKDFIVNTNSKYYLDNFIRPNFYPDDGHARTAEPFVASIFGSYDNFEEFINSNHTYENIVVIRNFFGKFKGHGYQALRFENPEKELKIESTPS